MSPTNESIHEMARTMFQHLKNCADTPEQHAHIFKMIRAAELSAKGLLDDAQAEAAMKDIESAALFCEPESVAASA